MAVELSYSLCFLLLLLQQLTYSTTAQTSNNIPLGSSLIADEQNSSWASPSGEFAFGFQKIGEGGFILAIWFNKIPEKTIVWSANRGSLVPRGSTVELTSDGQLLLHDIVTGNSTSVVSSAGTGVTHAAMLDSGNFVLANQNSTSLWETFNEPTDTILPTQIFRINSTLYASYTKTNYSRGRFMLRLKSNGNLMFSTTNFPLDSSVQAYWSTKTSGSQNEVIFNQSGSIYIKSRDGSILYNLSSSSSNPDPIEDYYQRATLDYDGVLRHYTYLKGDSTNERIWSTSVFLPPNICTSVLDVGGGACGYNSLCRNDDVEGPSCQCPDGYAIIDSNDQLKGCKQTFAPQSCEETSQGTDLFYLHEMRSTDWFSSANYESFGPVDEEMCRQSCLGDCFCDIVFYKSKTCYKKSIPLSNGRIDWSSNDWKALIKIRNLTASSKSTEAVSVKNDNTNLILHGFLFLICSSLFVFLCLVATSLLLYRIYHRVAKVSKFYPEIQGVNLRCFTYMELEEATDGFKTELGHGAFATVFKGVLVSDNGKCVAVKRLLDTMVRESDQEFKSEVSTIGKTNHRNLVQLLGFCNEGQHRFLVYQLMSNGTLASFLFWETKLNWHRRKQIALEIARGLLYLHEDCNNQIIHCDIKPENVLLDDTFTARIADFGLAKLLKTDQTRTITAIRGTKGYVAPEWFKALPITAKVDVYSYGILLLEIICCRKNFEAEASDEKEMVLSEWTYNCYSQKKLHLLLENDDDAMDDIKKVEKYVITALWCIQQDPSVRPTMKNVTQMLEGSVEISVPPNPSL